MSLGSRLREAREKKGWSQLFVAQKIGISNSNISNYERDYREPDVDTLLKFAVLYEVTTDWLFEKTENPTEQKFPRSLLTSNKTDYIQSLVQKMREEDSAHIITDLVRIPILGTIKAGYDLYAHENIEGYSVMPKEDVMDGEYFFLKVTGDSMIGEGIREGFRVLVRKQDYVENGKIGVVLVNGDEATLKRVFYAEDSVTLFASNPSIPPRTLPISDVFIQGQVTKVEFDV